MECSDYLNGITNNDRYIIAKAISLVESNLKKDKRKASELLDSCINLSNKSIRIAISGNPGVGKSTFIEALGSYLVNKKLKTAIITIDPSSTISGGSILADKTRMKNLSKNKYAYVRPAANDCELGGINKNTRDTISIFETAGYDVIIIETVGVGQSEIDVKSITDIFLYLTQSESGDVFQFIKKGILELCDFIIINKIDLDLEKSKSLKFLIENNLKLHNSGNQSVFICSAIEGNYIYEIWLGIKKFFEENWKKGKIQSTREKQNINWYKQRLKKQIFRKIEDSCLYKESIKKLENENFKNPNKFLLEIIDDLKLN
tara:strand:+ start:644 stop:1594 length:951 start_codon:yes stop_codon:yes gene_type:complete